MSTIVTTQEELDAAIESGAEGIVIDSPPTVWLVIRGKTSVEARGHSHVVAWDWTRVEACDWSRVVAWDSSYVVAWDYSYVVAWDSSNVVAWDSSRVEAWDYSHVAASRWVTVHRRSARATITGGIIIDMPSSVLRDPAAWVAYQGIATKDGAAVVYKAVSQELAAGQRHTPTTYTIGSTVEATDWDPDPGCGPGLHFSPTPSHASLYYQGDGEPRFLACEVDVASLVPLGNKCKAPSCRVLHEVDKSGEPVVDALDTEQETTP